MIFEKKVWAFRCERCGYEWIPRKPWSEGEDLPTVCPSCKSPYWNKARTMQPWTPLPPDVHAVLAGWLVNLQLPDRTEHQDDFRPQTRREWENNLKRGAKGSPYGVATQIELLERFCLHRALSLGGAGQDPEVYLSIQDPGALVVLRYLKHLRSPESPCE